jgi:hypothetical protein
VNVVYVRAAEGLPEAGAFARQAGFQGGTLESHSWVLHVDPVAFDDLVDRLQKAGVPALAAEPLEPQPGYRQFVVRDPMGFTVEVYRSEDGR